MNNEEGSEMNTRSFLKNVRVRPFKVDIVMLFCAIIIPAVIAITSFTYYKNSAAALKMVHLLAEKMTRAVMEKTVNHLKPAQATAEITARLVADPEMDIGPGSNLEDYLIGIVRAQPQIDIAYYGTAGGDFIMATWLKEDEPIITKFISRKSGQPRAVYRYYDNKLKLIKEEKKDHDPYDPRERPWYKESKATMSKGWTDLYIFASTGKPGITAASPVVTHSGKFIGVTAADITIVELSNFLKQVKISENGVAFILDNKRQFVAFPDPERTVKVRDGKIVPVKATELNESWIADALGRFVATGKSNFNFESEGKRYLAFFTPFPPSFGKDWTIVILAPEDDFLGPIKKTHKETLMISGLILLLSIGCGLRFARNISRPIEQLTELIQKIKGFDLEGKEKISTSINEIQMMSNAVDAMKNGLKAFRKYVPATLVGQLIESGEEAKPGGRERELTLFFSDIDGFTTISEQIPPRELMVNLSEYLDVMSGIIRNGKGTVDKYIGDSVMAFWGAPLPNDEHAVSACKAALKCQRAINALNERWLQNNVTPFITRMGLHTGFTIVGNMGSAERLNYTVLGDMVNLASRLEGVNKLYETNIIISKDTHRYVRNEFILRPLDIIAVKGKTNSVLIYELMGDDRSDDATVLQNLAQDFQKMFDLYLDRQWKEALPILERLKKHHPDDRPVDLYLERCRSYLEKDPGPEWGGIIRLNSK